MAESSAPRSLVKCGTPSLAFRLLHHPPNVMIFSDADLKNRPRGGILDSCLYDFFSSRPAQLSCSPVVAPPSSVPEPRRRRLPILHRLRPPMLPRLRPSTNPCPRRLSTRPSGFPDTGSSGTAAGAGTTATIAELQQEWSLVRQSSRRDDLDEAPSRPVPAWAVSSERCSCRHGDGEFAESQSESLELSGSGC
jgi:hypothetical protein